MKSILASIGVLAVSVGTIACVGFEHSRNVLGPTDTSTGTLGSFVGIWTSETVEGLPSPSSCSNLQWRVTTQTDTSLSGEFAATCSGGLSVIGTASGQLNGSEVPMQANGTATLPGFPPCSFSLTGTGHREGDDAIRISYSGTTCMGPVQGEEILRRATPTTTSPPPPPPPPPPPDGNSHHVRPGPLTAARAQEVVFATSSEFPHLRSPRPTEGQAVAAAEELLRRMIWHLQLAGYQAGRQRNPSGAISNDKLTVAIDGGWRAYDVFIDYGVPGAETRVNFLEVFPANPIGDSGIPD